MESRIRTVRIFVAIFEFILFGALACIIFGVLRLTLLPTVAVMAGAATLFGVVYEYKTRKSEELASKVVEFPSQASQEPSLAAKAIRFFTVLLLSVGVIQVGFFAVEARDGTLNTHEFHKFILDILFAVLFIRHCRYALRTKTRF